MKEYYKILEVMENTTQEDIKKSYKKLAHKYHPDKNSDSSAKEKFMKIQEAYEVLSDPEKKNNYDTFGTAEPHTHNSYTNPFGDMFNNFAHQQSRKTKASEIRFTVNFSFEEAVNGKELNLELKIKEKCSACFGTGNDGGQIIKCSTCNGHGFIGRGGGFFSINIPCPSCNGKGEINTHTCQNCGGSGSTNKIKKINLKTKPGVNNNDRIIMRGQGNQDADIPGDIIIFINVTPHEFFQREGNDILIDIPISYLQATLGDEIIIPTISGKASITIPPRSEHGKILRLKNAGVNDGNFYVRLNIDIPKNISQEYKNKLQELEFIMPSSKNPQPKKIKSA